TTTCTPGRPVRTATARGRTTTVRGATATATATKAATATEVSLAGGSVDGGDEAVRGPRALGVELCARAREQFRTSVRRAARRPVGPRFDHRAIRVDDRDDPRAEGDLLAGEPVRIAAAVPALVMAAHDLQHLRRCGAGLEQRSSR